MRPSFRNISKKARAAAAGSAVPAGQEPPSPDAPATPTAGERGGVRRRARRLRRTREVLLRELGLLVVEMRRLGRDNPDLVARKAAEVSVIDEQLRGLGTALADGRTVEQVVAAGVAGSCGRCGTLLATEDRFCSRCGQAVAGPAADGSAAQEEGAAQSDSAASEPPPPPPPPAAELATGSSQRR